METRSFYVVNNMVVDDNPRSRNITSHDIALVFSEWLGFAKCMVNVSLCDSNNV